ncbi:MAG TPA: 3-methyl-2-oxobutanoate hydroxymethyltransferase [Stellaceae bacterium]|nr:3-methyl-2-oxobutanoate hydroxymethyltransferase [Stellaceae bacterium]
MNAAAPAPASSAKKLTPASLARRKGGEPIVCLTAYSTPMARLLDPIADLLLVGDSLGMVIYGFESTLPVTMEMMIAHGAAAVRGAKRACVIVDMPFGAYQGSPDQAFQSAARIMAETGAAGVKLEGGEAMAETVRFLVDRGIPVLAHIGLQPQSVNVIGGFRAQGRNEAEAARVLADARAVAQAGCFAIVIEGTSEPVARRATEAVHVPTIGIGASPACDGQILVTEDLLGLSGMQPPRFVKRYAELGPMVTAAATAYAEEVRARRFPGPEHCYGPSSIDNKPEKPAASTRAR